MKELLLALVLSTSEPVISQEECVTINEKVFCTSTQQTSGDVLVGKSKLKVTDPAALLREAKKQQIGRLKKSGLWDYYEYPPFVIELAKQNNMDPGDLIEDLAEEEIDPNPWKTLSEVARIYESIQFIHGEEQTLLFFDRIMVQIMEDVLVQLELSLDHDHV